MHTVFVSGELPRGLPRFARATPVASLGGVVPRLSQDFEVVHAPEGVRSAAFDECASRVRAIVALLTDRIDDALLARCPELRVVANVAVGVDNVDLAACAARNVLVTNTPDVLTEATADLAFGLLIDAARRISEGDRLVRSGGGWSGWTPTFMLGAPVHGATLGIVGLGRIGKAMARRARGFGMPILYHQRSRLQPDAMERALGATFVTSLDDLLAASDFVSIHVPLTPETHHLFDATRLARMKRGSVLVNTARGPIIDEPALAHALANGPLVAAGLDVFENEPKVHPSLLALSNVVLAPHIGSADEPTRIAMARIAAENVLRVLAGEPPLSPVRG